MFCELCEAIFSEQTPDDFDEPKPALSDRTLHADFDSLVRSANQKCQICCRIYAEVRARGFDKHPTSTEYLLWTKREYGKTLLWFEQYKGTSNTTILRYSLTQVTTKRDAASPLPCDIGHSTTASTESIMTAAKWLERCISEHSSCSVSQSDSWYPSRLLYIGRGQSDHVVLRSTKECPPDGPYIALSHCWGAAPMKLKLTSASQTLLEEGFLIQELPKLFQDVVTVVQRLRVHYLWIDSLCIMQDSHGDWVQEASQMAEIYGNSFCTIAATRASDSTQSLFSERIEECTEVEAACVSGEKHKYSIMPSTLWADDLDHSINAPLSRRAWVVQEQILSPRVLHFARTQIFWECHTASYCEMYPSEVTYEHSSGWPGAKAPMVQSDPVTRWTKALERYTKCQLTKQSDKLAAIAGVAKRLQGEIEGDYIAGIWIRYAAYLLQWERADSSPSNQDLHCLPDHFLPTWSWLSFKGAVRSGWPLPCTDIKPCIEVINYQSFPRANDNFLNVKGVTLTLYGTLYNVQLHNKTSVLDAYDLFFEPYQSDTSIRTGDPWCGVETVIYFDIVIDRGENVDALLLPLATDTDCDDQIRGLIVAPINQEEKIYYHRMGTFTTDLVLLDEYHRDMRLQNCSIKDREIYSILDLKHFLGFENVRKEIIEII